MPLYNLASFAYDVYKNFDDEPLQKLNSREIQLSPLEGLLDKEKIEIDVIYVVTIK